jgi:hypothetical protein
MNYVYAESNNITGTFDGKGICKIEDIRKNERKDKSKITGS